MSPKTRRGASLFEIVVALAIFSVVMAGVMQSVNGVNAFIGQEESIGDEAVAGRIMMNQVINDMANSAWFYNYNSTLHQFILTTQPPYPGVTKDTTSAATMEKDSLEYIKIRTSQTVASSPYNEHYDNVSFMATANPPAVVTLDQYVNAPSTPYLILNPNYPQAPSTTDIYITHVWEYYLGSSGTGNNFDQNQDPTRLRHYRLEVINVDPVTKTGNLVRSYYNGSGTALPTDVNGSWTPSDQKILMDHVLAFVVDTCYTDTGASPGTAPFYQTTGNILNTNQLRFTVVVQRPQDYNANVKATSTFTFTAAMRSITH